MSIDAMSGWIAPVCVGELVGRSVTVHLPSVTFCHLLSIACNVSFSVTMSTSVGPMHNQDVSRL